MGAEQPKEEKGPTVGEMEAEDFFSVFAELLRGLLERKRQAGDERLMDLSVKEFTSAIVEQVAHRQLATATAETRVAERVLTDWASLQAVGAVAQPFRIKNKEQLDDFYKSILDAGLGREMKGEFIVAVAIVSPEGGVRKGP